MVSKTLTVIRPGRYGTRMLKAGENFEVTAPEARLFVKLGWAREPFVRAAMASVKPEVREIISEAVTENVAPGRRGRRRKTA